MGGDVQAPGIKLTWMSEDSCHRRCREEPDIAVRDDPTLLPKRCNCDASCHQFKDCCEDYCEYCQFEHGKMLCTNASPGRRTTSEQAAAYMEEGAATIRGPSILLIIGLFVLQKMCYL